MFSRQNPKPFRRRLLRGWYRTLNDNLRQRVTAEAERRGVACPRDDSSAFIRIATAAAPALLEKVRHLKRLLTGGG
jgi:hypothetical protein